MREPPPAGACTGPQHARRSDRRAPRDRPPASLLVIVQEAFREARLDRLDYAALTPSIGIAIGYNGAVPQAAIHIVSRTEIHTPRLIGEGLAAIRQVGGEW